MNQWNRTAPVTLARDTPVAQSPLHALATQALLLERRGDGIDRRMRIQAGELPRPDQHARLGIGALPLLAHDVVSAGRRLHHGADPDPMALGEFEVALT